MTVRSTDQVEHGLRGESLPDPSDLISGADVFPDERIETGDEDRDERAGFFPALPGPLIAAATFVPTFLAVFFGLSYLLGLGTEIGPMASPPAPSTATVLSGLDAPGSPPLSDAIRDPFVAPRASDSPSMRPSDPREALPGSSVADTPAPTVESTGPTRPPALPRAAISAGTEPRAGRATEEPRQPQAAVLTTPPERTPEAQPRKGGSEWTPAAAFADRGAASRLASSIQQQGYPVEIRQEQSSARPWVVWIGAQPRGGERRR